jgi:hypothetical protein
MHGVEANHLRTVRVRERAPSGETVWGGDVEVFALVGHLKALKAYAWSRPTPEGTPRFYAVLHVGSVDSAAEAVRASIADARKARSA